MAFSVSVLIKSGDSATPLAGTKATVDMWHMHTVIDPPEGFEYQSVIESRTAAWEPRLAGGVETPQIDFHRGPVYAPDAPADFIGISVSIDETDETIFRTGRLESLPIPSGNHRLGINISRGGVSVPLSDAQAAVSNLLLSRIDPLPPGFAGVITSLSIAPANSGAGINVTFGGSISPPASPALIPGVPPPPPPPPVNFTGSTRMTLAPSTSMNFYAPQPWNGATTLPWHLVTATFERASIRFTGGPPAGLTVATLLNALSVFFKDQMGDEIITAVNQSIERAIGASGSTLIPRGISPSTGTLTVSSLSVGTSDIKVQIAFGYFEQIPLLQRNAIVVRPFESRRVPTIAPMR